MPFGSRVSTEEQWKKLLAFFMNNGLSLDSVRVKLVDVPGGGRGLVALEDIPRSTVLLSVPSNTLLNVRSLPYCFASQYPALNAVQTLSLYLSVRRFFQRTEEPYSDGFETFVESLPEGFETVPLTWQLEDAEGWVVSQGRGLTDRLEEIQKEVAEVRSWGRLIHVMSPTTRLKVDDVLRRFGEDWDAVVTAIKGEYSNVSVGDFLWGWMNVNSRCFWHELDLERGPDNITLAAGIDMANHLPYRDTRPVQTPHNLVFYSSQPRSSIPSPVSQTVIDPTSLSSPPWSFALSASSKSDEPLIKEGEEVCFTYGPHCNTTLLAEYGFVLEDGVENPWDAVDVTGEVVGIFMQLEDAEEREEKKATLEAAGYWGDYTIQCHPTSEPSHRTLVALRLFHLDYHPLRPRSSHGHRTPKRQRSNTTTTTTIASPSSSRGPFSSWQAHVRGETDLINATNEARVKSTMREVCARLARDARCKLERVEALALEDGWRDGERGFAVGCVERILRQEVRTLSDCAKGEEGLGEKSKAES